jgi:hypothetical protein
MGWFGPSTWQIILSVAAPVAVALVLFALEARGPLAPVLQKPLGLVAGYFTAVAILFGLMSALLMNDVWQKENAARQSVQAEDDALRALFQLARTNELPELNPLLKAYAATAAKENPWSRAAPDARQRTDRAYEAIVSGVSQAHSLESGTRAFILSTAVEMRRARDRRLYVADDETVGIKWLSMIVLGALTQIAILLVHTGERAAVRISVSLFTVAFSFCLLIVAIFDTPFEMTLASEPGKTFGQTLKEFQASP